MDDTILGIDSSTLIGIAVVGFGIWLIILYNIIKGALYQTTWHIRIGNRLMIKKLRNDGFTKKELKDIYEQTDEMFWETIKDDPETEIETVQP
jgi:hypothetical protein